MDQEETHDLIRDLKAMFGEPKFLFPGALYFVMPGRLERDMTDSTDWNLIYHEELLLHTDRATGLR